MSEYNSERLTNKECSRRLDREIPGVVLDVMKHFMFFLDDDTHQHVIKKQTKAQTLCTFMDFARQYGDTHFEAELKFMFNAKPGETQQ